MELTCCHGNLHDVRTSLAKVLPNNRATKLFIVNDDFMSLLIICFEIKC